jgi:hypothetical protein
MKIMDAAVLLYNNHPKIKINGSIIDAFEYYFAILEFNSDIKLLLVDFTPEFRDYLFGIVEERYYLNDLNWKENVQLIKRKQIIQKKFKIVLIVDYSTINRLKGLIFSDKIIIISELYTDISDYFMSPDLYNIEYYGEMPFVYKDREYRMKLLFDRFKEIDSVKNGIYIHSPNNEDRDQLIKDLKITETVPFYFKQSTHMHNFMSYFNYYIYFHANKYFDPHPRLPLECFYYNKRMKYINNHKIKDGSHYRFEDLKLNGLKNRTLNKNDEVVGRFI